MLMSTSAEEELEFLVLHLQTTIQRQEGVIEIEDQSYTIPELNQKQATGRSYRIAFGFSEEDEFDVDIEGTNDDDAGLAANAEEEQEICKAAHSLDLEYCKSLIESGRCNVNDYNPNNVTPLLMVCQRAEKHEEALKVAQYLLDKGADLDTQTSGGITALIQAIRSKNTALAQLLFDRGANPSCKSTSGWSALHQTATSKNLVIMQRLVGMGVDIFTVNKNDCTALIVAVKNNFLDGVKFLLEVAGNRAAELADLPTVRGQNGVGIASGNGFVEVLQLLIEHGVDCNAKMNLRRYDFYYLSVHPLSMAARKGHRKCMEMLLPHVKKEALEETELDPIMAALYGQSLQCLRLLLDAGYPVEVFERNEFIASCMANSEYLRPIFRSVTVTPLCRAVYFSENSSIIQAVIKAGAKMTYVKDHCSPFLIAVRRDVRPDMLRQFLENDVDINAKSDGRLFDVPDALINLVYNGNVQQAFLLLRCGLDPALEHLCKCKNGRSLLSDLIRVGKGWRVIKLVKLLIIFSPGVPSCCNEVAKAAFIRPKISTLKHLCRLAIRKPLRTSQLLDGQFFENLPLPKTLKEYLDFQTIPDNLKS